MPCCRCTFVSFPQPPLSKYGSGASRHDEHDQRTCREKKLFRQFSHPPGAAFSCRKTPKNSAHTLLPTRKREENASIVSPKGHRKRGEKKAQFWGVFWVEKETPEDGGCGRPTRTFAPAVKSTLLWDIHCYIICDFKAEVASEMSKH